MGLFDILKRNKRYNEIPIKDNIDDNVRKSPSAFENGIYIERRDKTYLDIIPKVDKTGHQMYKQVYNPTKKQMQNLGIWLIDYKISGYLQAEYLDPDIREIYLDEYITPEWFTQGKNIDSRGEVLQDFLANEVLSRERLEKIIENREGYVGGVVIDQNECFRKHTYSKIIEELKAERETGITSQERHRDEISKINKGEPNLSIEVDNVK